MFGLRRLVSQILFLDDHFSELMIKSSYPPDFTGCSQTSGFREDIRFTPLSGAYSAHSEIAAGGIACRFTSFPCPYGFRKRLVSVALSSCCFSNRFLQLSLQDHQSPD